MGNAVRKEELLAAEQAAEWVDRMKAADPATRAEFYRWLCRSPLHVREMLLAGALDRDLDHLDPERKFDIDKLIAQSTANVVSIRPHEVETAPAARPRRRRWRVLGATAGLAAAILIAVLWVAGPPGLLVPGRFETAIGEQRTVPLADGSLVHLNTRTRVTVRLTDTARDVYLQDGQAIFKVKHDPGRPFRVHVDASVIEAVGTEFDVYRRDRQVDVTVLEGRVKVVTLKDEAGAGPGMSQPEVFVDARQATRITPGDVSAPEPADIEAVAAWRQRVLICRSKRLDEIAAEYNRYNSTPRIVVEGADLQGRLYSGTYHVDEPRELLMALAADEGLEVDDRGDIAILRPRPPR